jgi:hypothetical protein
MLWPMTTMTALLLKFVLATAPIAGSDTPALALPDADETSSEYTESAPLLAAPVEIVRISMLIAAPVEIVRVPLERAAALASRVPADRR